MMKWMVCWIAVAGPLWAFQWERMPDWVQRVMAEVDLTEAPADADLWTLLDETEINLKADGQFKQRRRLLKYVIKDRGALDASLFIINGDEQSTKIKKLKGWHRRAKGSVDKLDKNNVLTLGTATAELISNDIQSVALFEGVAKGSLVAFESLELHDAFFKNVLLSLLSEHPIRKSIVRLSLADSGPLAESHQAVVRAIQFDAWNLDHEVTENAIEVRNIPALGDERFVPSFIEPFPRVFAGFFNRDQARETLSSWDHYARWYHGVFKQAALPAGPVQGKPAGALGDLRDMHAWLQKNISYRQKYLSPGRGWTPVAGAEVVRRAYGDCKDMVACLAHQGNQRGIEVLPVLANIGDGFRTTATDDPSPNFDHLIAAIPLAQSLDLPAEVTVDGKLFLIVDPTSKNTPLGYLPGYYHQRHVMLCTDAGAGWIAIPDSALEAQALKVEVSGWLDGHLTLTGNLIVTEQGNAAGLRATAAENNPLDLEWTLRLALDLPGIVNLEHVKQNLDEENQLYLEYRLKWPSFLLRDADGVRLPRGITGGPKVRLVKVGKTRRNPIAFERWAPILWKLDLHSEAAWMPGKTETAWEGQYHQFQWRAQGGKHLVVEFAKKRRPAYFSKDKLEEGLAYWQSYRDAFNGFWLGGTLFKSP